jgi:hypothetical protein
MKEIAMKSVSLLAALVLLTLLFLQASSAFSQQFSIANKTLVIDGFVGTAVSACIPPEPRFASIGDYFASSAGTLNRCCQQSCNANLTGTLTLVAYINQFTRLPEPPSLFSIPAELCTDAITDILVPVNVSVATGSCCQGTAYAFADIGGVNREVMSSDGECTNQENNFTAEVSIPANTIAFTIPISLTAIHQNASCKLGYASIRKNEISLLTTCSRPLQLDPPTQPLLTLRQGDWDRGYTSTTLHMNPGPDYRFVPVWSYDYITSSGLSLENAGIDSTPWYATARNPLIWDENWQGSGQGLWARANDVRPDITRAGLTHYLDPDLAIYVPVIAWIYRYNSPATLRLTGQLDIVWGGAAGSPVNVNLVIAKRDSLGNIQAALDTVLVEPSTKTYNAILDGINFICNTNDAIIIAARGLDNAPGRNIQLLDADMQWNLEALRVGISDSESPSIPVEFELYQNYPNPFNPETQIKYTISEVNNVRLAIYNNLGQLVKVLVESQQVSGTYTVAWNGRDKNDRVVQSGTYYFQLKTDKGFLVKKLLLVK